MSMEATGILATIVRGSLRFRGIVVSLTCILGGYGIYSFTQAKYDVFPEFAPPQVVIQTEAAGLSPGQVEVLVTQPIENAINGVASIQTMRSNSIQGLSVVTVTFDAASDVFRDRQALTERLATILSHLPRGVQAPVMSPLTSSTSMVMAIGLTSDKLSLMELRTIADFIVKPKLLAEAGVANAVVFGGDVKEIQIQVRPKQLIKYSLAIEDVMAAAAQATGIRGAGFIDTPNQRIVLQSEGQSLTSNALSKTVLAHQNGFNVTLSDVARVVEAPAPPFGFAAVMGKPAVQIVISEQYRGNTLEVTEHIDRALQELKPSLEAQGAILHADIFRPANFIEVATRNVKASLLMGGVLVVIVLALFLFNLRTAAISLTAIPLSLLTAITVMDYLEISLNTMTLGGLAIAIGLLVDDAVITVENVYRRLRENQHVNNPRSVFQVILDATLEVRSAVVYATLAIAVVFLPVLTLPGVAGRLFSPLGVAYILATLASLIVALVVTPSLCYLMLIDRALPEHEPPLVHWLKSRYNSLLTAVERRYRIVIAVVAFFSIAGLATLPFLGGEFLPDLKEGHFIIHMSMMPGTSLQESFRVGNQVVAELSKLPAVRLVAQRVGRAENADDTWGTHYSEINVDLKPVDNQSIQTAQADIRTALAQFPGINFGVKTFLSERIEETLSGYSASVVVNLYGNDLDILDGKAQEIAKVLGNVSGAAEVQIQSPLGTPQLAIRLRPESLSRWGFDSVQVLDVIRTAYQGDVVGQVYEGNRVFNVSVNLNAELRKNIDSVGDLPLRNSIGTYVRLSDLADIYQGSGRYVVLHNGARRVQAITCNVTGRDVASFVAEAKRQIASISLPAGSYVEFGGTSEAQSRSMHDLIAHSAIAGMGIILLLSLVLRNRRNLVLVFVNLPLALVGGVLAVIATGGIISIGSLVGFVTLFGITLRNSIMMLSHYEHLVADEGVTWGLEVALRGAQERLAPILMTALVTALGLLPLALGSNAPGREIEGPMAIVILGGLLTSTALNLLILPGLALRYGRFESKIVPDAK
jgi:CzcA family heavy metal efflux pump